jgi:hypothetical protein
VAALWIGLTALVGRTYHLAPALVAAAPGVVARLLGLSVVGGGAVGASVAVAGAMTALGAWGFLELAGLSTTATLWLGLPGGVRAEIVLAIGLGAFGGVLAIGARARRGRPRARSGRWIIWSR